MFEIKKTKFDKRVHRLLSPWFADVFQHIVLIKIKRLS